MKLNEISRNYVANNDRFTIPIHYFFFKVTYKAEKFLAHVPLTRLVKECFIKWHNYYRHRVAGGKAKNTGNSKNFPKASRMRELIWDRELAFISHNRTKLVVMGKDTCHATQRFPHAGQNIVRYSFLGLIL